MLLAAMDEITSNGGRRRTAELRDMKEEAVAVSISGGAKKRKVDESESELNSAENRLLSPAAEEECSVFTADSTSSSSSESSSWSSSHVELSKDHVRSTDLKLQRKDSGMEIPTVNICQFSRETSPATSELSAEDMESSSSATTTAPTKVKSSLRNSSSSAAQMPSSAEIEEFFASAEKHEQKQFAEKYNYDIVKDVPLEGRYQWIRLKP